MSVGHPFVKLRVSALPGKGFVITLTDPTKREVTTPTITFEAMAKATEGRSVIIRNGGFLAEFAPHNGFLRVKAGPLAGLCLEGSFRVEDLEAAVQTATDRNHVF